MSKLGDWLGRSGGLRQLGEGYSIAPEDIPAEVSALYPAFSAGIVAAQDPTSIPQNAAAYAVDMEVNRQGRLVRSPGFILVEDATGRNLRWTFEQASLEFTTELVTVDPPWLGYKGPLGYNWVNLGIAATLESGWTALNAAGDLIFSNGRTKSYLRVAGAATITDISAEVVAETFALAFGRMFAGAVTTGGVYDALGLAWNAASGFSDDWTGFGAGGELLLADLTDADKIVALNSLGFDALAILCRKSLWVGHPTDAPTRPADPRIRFLGFGCAARDTVRSTPHGVTFLGDDGVTSFNLNRAWVISEAINSLLLPIDYSRIHMYTAAYLPHSQRYLLGTPVGTFIYDFPLDAAGGVPERPARWFFRSFVPDKLLTWAEQSGTFSWDQIVGSWDAQTLAWEDLEQLQSFAPARLHVTKGSKLAREDYGVFNNLGTSLTPLWQTPNNEKAEATREWSTLAFEITYHSIAPSQIRVGATDDDGEWGATTTKTLPSTNGKSRSYMLWHTSTGLGARAQIEVLSGQPEIVRIRQVLIDSGPSTASL